MATPASDPVIQPSFPRFDAIRVRMPIVASKMTIWPGPKETFREWLEGFPYELHPCAWDYMWISCDGYKVKIQPHYADSTWDTFWTNGAGHVTAHALGGLFPFTLGKEVNLIRGIVDTLGALPDLVRSQSPETAHKICEIHEILQAEKAPPPAGEAVPDLSRWRERASEAIWRRKLRRLRSSSDEGSSTR